MKVYVVTHKAVNINKMEGYSPLFVGALGKETPVGYLRDDNGDNISNLNSSYCELTGLYWIWKNSDEEIIGICHYRRFFVKFESPYIRIRGIYIPLKKQYHIMSTNELKKQLLDCDILVKESGDKLCSTEVFFKNGRGLPENLLGDLENIISRVEPNYLDAFQKCLRYRTHFNCNMLVTSKKYLDDYCEWLFPILKEYDNLHYDRTGHKCCNREIGYAGEFLLRVWIEKMDISYKVISAINIESDTEVMGMQEFLKYCLFKIKSKLFA